MDYRKQRAPFLLTAVLFLGLCFQLPVQTLMELPVHQRVYVGQKMDFNLKMPKILADNLQFSIDGAEPVTFYPGSILPVAAAPGQLEVQVKLFGLIPVRNMTLSVVPEIKVMPGGQAIGVMLESEGVMIVGRSAIVDQKGIRHNPAVEAGINLGDILLKVDGKRVENEMQVRDLINSAKEKELVLELRAKGTGRVYETKIKPIFCPDTKRYRVGLYVRDTTAGVGTLTFYHSPSKSYGALGHIINDMDTGQPIDVAGGKIIGASIEGIRSGKRGQPGEKLGMFKADSDIYGNITGNTNCGVFGTLKASPKKPAFEREIPVAMGQEVKEGPAEIYTVLQGERIEKFNIEIQKINSQYKPDAKGLVIKVTDNKLLEQTGGIIQGMSGSPIIQDGKLVGAVTHVFVNDPARGYGVLAEWMLMDAGVLPKQISKGKTTKYEVRETIAC